MIKLHELVVVGETFVTLWATFQVCVDCDRHESKFVLPMLVSTMPVSILVSMN